MRGALRRLLQHGVKPSAITGLGAKFRQAYPQHDRRNVTMTVNTTAAQTVSSEPSTSLEASRSNVTDMLVSAYQNVQLNGIIKMSFGCIEYTNFLQ